MVGRTTSKPKYGKRAKAVYTGNAYDGKKKLVEEALAVVEVLVEEALAVVEVLVEEALAVVLRKHHLGNKLANQVQALQYGKTLGVKDLLHLRFQKQIGLGL